MLVAHGRVQGALAVVEGAVAALALTALEDEVVEGKLASDAHRSTLGVPACVSAKIESCQSSIFETPTLSY